MTTVQACLNGARPRSAHPALPLDATALAADARGCAAAGATSVHLHPRDAAGAETLDPAVVNANAEAVRDASGLPVGVSTGEWIVPDIRVGLEDTLVLPGGSPAPDNAALVTAALHVDL